MKPVGAEVKLLARELKKTLGKKPSYIQYEARKEIVFAALISGGKSTGAARWLWDSALRHAEIAIPRPDFSRIGRQIIAKLNVPPNPFRGEYIALRNRFSEEMRALGATKANISAIWSRTMFDMDIVPKTAKESAEVLRIRRRFESFFEPDDADDMTPEQAEALRKAME